MLNRRISTMATSQPLMPLVGPSANARSVAQQISVRLACEQGDDNTIWLGNYGTLASMVRTFSRSQLSADDLETDLHELWFRYYHGSKNISYNHPALDRLAFQLIQVQARGGILRNIPGVDEAEVATTPSGIIWTDLPFFTSDMIGFWLRDYAIMGSRSRHNFTAFLAKIASVGLNGNGLFAVALHTLRECLETPRQLGDDNHGLAEEGMQSMQDLTISDLLMASNCWILEAGIKLIQLSCSRWNDCSIDLGRPGVLYRNSQSDPAAPDGLSPSRWLFWLDRLQAISEEAREGGIASLANTAWGIRDNMLRIADESDSCIRRELDATLGSVRPPQSAPVCLG